MSPEAAPDATVVLLTKMVELGLSAVGVTVMEVTPFTTVAV